MREEQLSGSARRIYKSLAFYLHQKSCFGESKHEAKEESKRIYLKEHGNLRGWNPSKLDGIYSIRTMSTYVGQMRPFAAYCASHYRVKRVSDITVAMGEDYLRFLDATYSAYTVSTASSAINKALGWELSPKKLGLKGRKKANIKKCREGEAYTEREFDKYEAQITIARAIGARRSSIYNKNNPNKLITPNRCVRNEDSIVIGIRLIEKGGKVRVAPVLTEYQDAVTEIVNRLAQERGKDTPLFDFYGGHIRNHMLRAEYAAKLLHQLENERAAGEPLFGGEFLLSDYSKSPNVPPQHQQPLLLRRMAILSGCATRCLLMRPQSLIAAFLFSQR